MVIALNPNIVPATWGISSQMTTILAILFVKEDALMAIAGNRTFVLATMDIRCHVKVDHVSQYAKKNVLMVGASVLLCVPAMTDIKSHF